MPERVCLIPARGGSRRIPRKNIRHFHGRPIIAYSIENGQRVCDRVIVSTEDAEIAQLALDMGAEVHQRSFAMARDDVGTQTVAQNALREMRIKRPARVLVLYPCAPLVTAGDLRCALEFTGSYLIAVGVNPLRDAGAFYVGRAGNFMDEVPLWNNESQVLILPDERVCDINTEEDWTEAERKFESDLIVQRVALP